MVIVKTVMEVLFHGPQPTWQRGTNLCIQESQKMS